jgi:hypothetical protein
MTELPMYPPARQPLPKFVLENTSTILPPGLYGRAGGYRRRGPHDESASIGLAFDAANVEGLEDGQAKKKPKKKKKRISLGAESVIYFLPAGLMLCA